MGLMDVQVDAVSELVKSTTPSHRRRTLLGVWPRQLPDHDGLQVTYQPMFDIVNTAPVPRRCAAALPLYRMSRSTPGLRAIGGVNVAKTVKRPEDAAGPHRNRALRG
jgi:hypothetical protein